MNFNKRYSNNEMEWRRINQCPGSCFPSDWNYQDEDCYGDNDQNNDYNQATDWYNHREDKCYYGKFMFCEKKDKNFNNGYNNDQKCEDKKTGPREENCRTNNKICRCPFCCLFRNIHR